MEIPQKVRKLEKISKFGLFCTETGKLFSLKYGLNMIGRKSCNQIQTKCIFSSKIHAAIEMYGDSLPIKITDFSRHGTHIGRLNTEKVECLHKDDTEIYLKDMIIIGYHSFTLVEIENSVTNVEIDD